MRHKVGVMKMKKRLIYNLGQILLPLCYYNIYNNVKL